MCWADDFGLSIEATRAYWNEYPKKPREFGSALALKPINRWDRLAALNRAARKEDA
jgi:hypothetical protein